MFTPGVTRFRFRRLEEENGALLDHKNAQAYPVPLLRSHRVRFRDPLLPWRIREKQLPVVQDGDCEPMDLSKAPRYHVATARMTGKIRREESFETARQISIRAGSARAAKDPADPLIVVAEISILVTLMMIGWRFLQSNAIF